MNHQDGHHQAEQLEKIFQEVKHHEDAYNNREHSTTSSKEIKDEYPEIDVLNLPPRSEAHKTHEQRWKFKLNKATWRFILISLVLLIIAMFILYDVLFLHRIVLFTKFTQSINYTVEIFSYNGR